MHCLCARGSKNVGCFIYLCIFGILLSPLSRLPSEANRGSKDEIFTPKKKRKEDGKSEGRSGADRHIAFLLIEGDGTPIPSNSLKASFGEVDSERKQR